MTTPTPSASMSTTTSSECAKCDWDVVVIGAGPAGALAARETARLGSRTLLLEKSRFPRWKVCGCCLNGAALDALNWVGLGQLPDELQARRTTQWQLCTRTKHAVCGLPRGVSLSRTALDAELVRAAVDSDVEFLDETQATVGGLESERHVIGLSRHGHTTKIQAKIVIAADGLAGRALAGASWIKTRVQPAARLGAATVLEDGANFYQSGTIYMACGRGGYVGLVRLEDGRLEIAAAFDRGAVRRAGSPAAIASETLKEARLPLPSDLLHSAWRGTPALTRRPAQVAGRCAFVVGDAAGYIEPFTGEGIAWAMTSGIAVAPLAHQGALAWDRRFATSWMDWHRRLVARRQRNCRILARMLRTPALANVAALVLHHAPWMATPLIRAVNSPRTKNPRSLWEQTAVSIGVSAARQDTERLVTT